MDESTQKYYESLFEMYATDGWKALIEDLEAHAEQYKSIEFVHDERTLNFQKGRLDEVKFILGHEEFMKNAYEEILANADL